MKKLSITITLFFIGIAVAVFFIASTYPGSSGGAMGPGFFPMIIAGIVFFLCVLLLFSLRKQKDEGPAFFTKTTAVVFLSLVITAVYIAAIAFLGFPLATFLYLFGLMKFFSVKGWIFPLVLSASTTGIIYAVFTMFLSVRLPRGIFF